MSKQQSLSVHYDDRFSVWFKKVGVEYEPVIVCKHKEDEKLEVSFILSRIHRDFTDNYANLHTHKCIQIKYTCNQCPTVISYNSNTYNHTMADQHLECV